MSSLSCEVGKTLTETALSFADHSTECRENTCHEEAANMIRTVSEEN
jgi:hypothetical protein